MGMAQHPVEKPVADPAAWVDDYGEPLFRYAMTQVRDPNVAEDLVQETFLAALRNYKSFCGDSSFLTWLTAILRRKVADHRRQQRRQEDRQKALAPDDPFYSQLFDKRNRWRQTLGNWPLRSEDHLEEAEFWDVFDNCVAQLPPPLGEAFRLREIMAWSIEDICQVIGISNGNLAVRLHRARLSLRGCLEQRWFKG